MLESQLSIHQQARIKGISVSLPDMPGRLSGVTATILNDEIFVLGGNNGVGAYSDVADIYNISSRTWRKSSKHSSARYQASSCVYDKHVYLLAGRLGGVILTSLERYNPLTDQWIRLADRPISTFEAGFDCVNNKLYSFGGVNGAVYSNDIHCYDPITNSWSVINLPEYKPTPRAYIKIQPFKNGFFIFGGLLGPGVISEETWYYDIGLNEFTNLSPNIKQYGSSPVLLDGIIYLVSGWNGSSSISTIYRYDPLLDTWLPPIPTTTARFGVSVVTDGKYLYLPGGNISGGSSGALATLIRIE